MLGQHFVQALESRRLLAAFASLNSHGTLSVVGTKKGDTIVVEQKGNRIIASLGNQSLQFSTGQVKRIWANGFGGNDSISNLTSRPSTLLGAGGNDRLVGGSGNDQLDGGGGFDTADYSQRTADLGLEIDLDVNLGLVGGGGQAGEHDQFASIETILAGSGNDNLGVADVFDPVNESEPDGSAIFIDGGMGNDSFFTSSVNSSVTLIGGRGNDNFHFRIGSTQIFGGSGNDFFTNDLLDDDASVDIDAGSGFDTLEQSSFVDATIVMEPGLEKAIIHRSAVQGNDLNNIIITFGSSLIDGGGGNDKITTMDGGDVHGGDGNDTITGSAEDQELTGDAGNDVIHGGGGFDTIEGDSGNDILHGGPDNDRISGGTGRDQLFGEDGDDTLFAKDGRTDTLDGGDGFDKAQRDKSASITDVVKNVEAFI